MTALADIPAFTGEVHPFAARFPMLPDEDLDALASDIEANGLINPIVLDSDGRLIDGRNRLAACERAGIEPAFTIATVPDSVAFIIAANLQRRDLTQIQKAYYAVCSEVLESKTSAHGTTRRLARVSGVPESTIAQVSIVHRYAPESFEAVLAGSLTHQRAYEAAKAVKDEIAQNAAQLAEIQAKAPDLLTLGLPLKEAWAAYQARTEKIRKAAEQHAVWVKKLRDTLVEAVLGAQSATHPNNIAETLEGLAAHPFNPALQITPNTIREAGDALHRFADAMEANA